MKGFTILSLTVDVAARNGRSRLARKFNRKALDRRYQALGRIRRRRGTARPRAGPPIAGTEHRGGRRYYTLAQAQHGGQKSGRVRRSKAHDRHARIFSLRDQGLGIRAIARVVGCAASTVSRVLRGIIKSVAGTVQPTATRLPRISPTLAKRRIWLERAGQMVNEAAEPREMNKRLRVFEAESRRLEAYVRGIQQKGRGEVVANTIRFLKRLTGLDPLEAVRQVNSYYAS